jgi:hypothetical protein
VGFGNAYALEVFFFAWAVGTAIYVVRMVFDTQLDYLSAKERKVPQRWLVVGRGLVLSERWRLLHVLCLLYIGLWMVTHPPPNEIRQFLDREQLTVGRVLLAILIVSEGMAARTARRYREKARPHDTE